MMTPICVVVKTYAEIEGYLCFEAADGKETLEKLTNHSFDLILPRCHDAGKRWLSDAFGNQR